MLTQSALAYVGCLTLKLIPNGVNVITAGVASWSKLGLGEVRLEWICPTLVGPLKMNKPPSGRYLSNKRNLSP